jgi:hypothetical protein
MAIIQISKIQQRAGNLADLPQLDNGEFGWAADENRLFIGRTGNTYADENIEVVTSYSNISFSQISGSDGANFNINTPLNGQILTYVSSTDTWENYDGTTVQLGGDKLQLGDVSNISMTGGAIGYTLTTDGLGNLSWSPAGSGGSGGGAGGTNTSVQFNDSGLFNGSANFTYDNGNNILSVIRANVSYLTAYESVITANLGVSDLATLANIYVTNTANIELLNVSNIANVTNLYISNNAK